MFWYIEKEVKASLLVIFDKLHKNNSIKPINYKVVFELHLPIHM